MAMNGLRNLLAVLEQGNNEIQVEPATAEKAKLCINRMLDFAAAKKANVRPSGDLAKDGALFQNIGPA
jgi:quinolinate synthase